MADTEYTPLDLQISDAELELLPPTALRLIIRHLLDHITRQDQRIKELETKVSQLNARLDQNSSNSNKPPSSDSPYKENTPKTNKTKSGGRKGHEGHRQQLIPPTTTEIVHPGPCTCGCRTFSVNGVTHHALIAPKSIGERELAAKHFQHLEESDLVLLDLGYPAFWLFSLILFHKANFCSRISCKKWKIIRQFMKSGDREQVIMLHIPATSIAACQKLQLDTQPIRLRLVRVELDSGESEFLVTVPDGYCKISASPLCRTLS